VLQNNCKYSGVSWFVTARSQHLLAVDPRRGVKLSLVAFQTQHMPTLCKVARKVLFHKTIYASNRHCNIYVNKNSSIGLQHFFTVWCRSNRRSSTCTTKLWRSRKSPCWLFCVSAGIRLLHKLGGASNNLNLTGQTRLLPPIMLAFRQRFLIWLDLMTETCFSEGFDISLLR